MAEGLSVALPLAIGPSDGAYAVHKEIAKVAEQNLKMIILTSPGERIMEPTFGVGIRSFLFEQMTTSTGGNIRGSITRQIAAFLPYVRLDDLEIADFPDENLINIRISYSIPSIGITDEFVFPIST